MEVCSNHFLFIVTIYSGTGGLEGNGDIYDPDNLLEFQKFVLSSTDNQGVHFVMADGVSWWNNSL